MILVDYSVIQMQMIYGSINVVKPKKENGTYVTKDFIHVTKSFILHQLFDLYTKFSGEFGDMTICLDNSSSWRKNVYAPYKFMPTEMEAYLNQDNWDYCMHGAVYQWKEFNKLTLKEKRKYAKEYYGSSPRPYFADFIREKIMRTSK
jgi:hypothetical protein